ncbi:hypothetical protein VPNG_02195 [Cytospora leucostoma]|uniref:Uncharacterized protein n=1 Tax=Cytospora leucostoma TaxID=1230097 RepID=A0A423XH92_9PEZI|nr:hypothetical protein VPNG_02195 [Cytospora leucostoma]
MNNTQIPTGRPNNTRENFNVATTMPTTRPSSMARNEPTEEISNVATSLRELSIGAPIEENNGALIRAHNKTHPTPIGSRNLSTSASRPASEPHRLQSAAQRTTQHSADRNIAANIPGFLRPISMEPRSSHSGRMAPGVSRGPSANIAQRHVASENTAAVENSSSSNMWQGNARAASIQLGRQAPTTRATHEHGNQRLQGGRRPVNLATVQSWRPQQPREPQQHQPPQQRQPFWPMRAIIDPDAATRPLTEEEREHRRAKGISENYRGDAYNPENVPADIPDSENCSVWLTGMPADLSYTEYLSAVAIHKPGRIFVSNINRPKVNGDPSLLSSRTCGGKLTFYRPEEAARFLHLARMGLFTIQGSRIRATYNRVKVAAQPAGRTHTSRCLIISGPVDIVDEMRLWCEFKEHVKWDHDRVIILREDSRYRSLEWRFGSWRAQAEGAFLYLRRTYPEAMVSVRYSEDPCAPGGPSV